METTNTKKLVVLGLVGAVLIVLIVLIGTGAQEPDQTALIARQLSGPVIEDLVLGTGREAELGTVVTVHYTGKLTDGTIFDSSIEKGIPFQFPLGAGYVIPCWDQSLNGKKVGAKIRPSELAYGPTGVADVIPPNAPLVFEIEIINVEGGITE